MDNTNIADNTVFWIFASAISILITIVQASNIGRKYALIKNLSEKDIVDKGHDNLFLFIVTSALSTVHLSTMVKLGILLFKNSSSPGFFSWLICLALNFALAICLYIVGIKRAKKEQKEIEKN